MRILRLLLGGSPCQFWSAARTSGRETEPSGIGWELFRNYLIAGQKYKPDYFLYENNRSIAKAVREQITQELGVEPLCVNSALVSAQNRQRLYWTSIPGVEQPEDRRIFLKDILQSGLSWLDKSYCLTATEYKGVSLEHHLTHHIRNLVAEKAHFTTIRTDSLAAVPAGSGTVPMLTERRDRKRLFEVRSGMVSVNGRRLPIRLPDGFYLIRNLTVRECMRLQTVPEAYRFPVSATQAKKLLGNGWTCAVIAHILSHCPGIRTEPVEVLSMYDGMSCGRLALQILGANVIRYYATEIDRYAIMTTQANFPDTIQMGDAFQVRDNHWNLHFLTGS